MTATTKKERLDHANKLIEIIGSYGRRFFYSKEHNRFAVLELDSRGRVWFVDDYSGCRIYTHETNWLNKLRGFTHGGTLKNLVKLMRDYVVKGGAIDSFYIGVKPDWMNYDVWGYGDESITLVLNRIRGMAIPIVVFS